jgi:predicted Zn-ribbon and HTH transcriptional regulator
MVAARKSTDKEIGKVLLEGYRCRCGHEWLKRGELEPRVCPRCKSPRWDRPYLQPKEVEE